MYQHLSRRLRFFAMPAGDEGTPGAVPSAVPGDAAIEPAATSDNPSWAPYLEEFPEIIRPTAKKTFADWDSKVEKRFETIHQKYQPFKQFIDEGVDPTRVRNALGLADILERDPQGFAQLLAEQLGLTIQQAQEVVEELEDQEEPSTDPRITQLEEAQQQIMQHFQDQNAQQQREQLDIQQNQILDTELADLEKTYGKFNKVVKEQLLKEALRLTTVSGKPVSLTDAWKSLEAFVKAVREVPRPGQLAPKVLSGSNVFPAPAPEKPLGKLSDKETKSAVMDYVLRQS